MKSRVGRSLMAGALVLTLAACIPEDALSGSEPEPTTSTSSEATPSERPSPARVTVTQPDEPAPGEFDPEFYKDSARVVLEVMGHPFRLSRNRVAESIHRHCIGDPETPSEYPEAVEPESGYGGATRQVAVSSGACPSWSALALERESEETPEAPHTPRSTPPGVLYEAEGEGLMSVTYRTPTGTVQGDISEVMRNEDGQAGVFVGTLRNPYLSVQNRSGRSGPVTCRISVDGVVVSENTSHGRHVIATCNR